MLFASSINTASAEESTAQAPSPQSAEIMTIERPLLLQPRQSPPVCDDHTCGFRLLDESWKRGILPPGFKASGANDFKVENAGSVILERARAGETEGLYEASPPKLTFKFFGMDCELGTFTAGGKQEGGTRCPF
jgi:hypothetical protein